MTTSSEFDAAYQAVLQALHDNTRAHNERDAALEHADRERERIGEEIAQSHFKAFRQAEHERDLLSSEANNSIASIRKLAQEADRLLHIDASWNSAKTPYPR
jgi:hypothetical protein